MPSTKCKESLCRILGADQAEVLRAHLPWNVTWNQLGGLHGTVQKLWITRRGP